MELLKITDLEHPELDGMFEDVTQVRMEQVSPQITGGLQNVSANGEPISNYDSAFMEIPPENAVFGRVLLELTEELEVNTNYPSTAFFVMSKKNYLYHVLHQKNISAPRTVAVATEKAGRNIDKQVDSPLIARRIEEMKETERKKLDTEEQIQGFTEGSNYEEDILLFHQHNPGDKYRCLVVGDQVISLQDDSDSWKFSKDSLKYSNISSEQRELVRKAVKKIGTRYAEVVLRGNQIFDINPNPDLQLYKDISGKNPYEPLSRLLKGEP